MKLSNILITIDYIIITLLIHTFLILVKKIRIYRKIEFTVEEDFASLNNYIYN